MDREERVKLIAGDWKIPVDLIYKGKRIFLRFGYNKTLLAEIKNFEGAKWHGYDDPPLKQWSIADSLRNQFQLKFLMGDNPYAWYDKPIREIKTLRPLYKHQYEMAAFGVTRHYCVLACEMGTGKTLAAIEIIEHLNENDTAFTLLSNSDIWYVGPKSGIYAVSREFVKWNFRFRPNMFTYEALIRHLRDNSPRPDFKVPRVVIFDESSKIKTPTAQRSEAALYLANAVRETYKDDGIVILMSGTPAPKSPADWFNQAECACPGFVKEGNINKFKARLCLIEERQSITGGVYPHIVTWLDDENKCAKCGQAEDDPNHATINAANGEANYHPFRKSVNEVQYLYKRLQGLVLVKFKKDCLDLPEKQYKVVHLKPSSETLRAAKLIKTMAPRAIQALTLLRELSDGFQYVEVKSGEETCQNCFGSGKHTGVEINESVNVVTATTETLLDAANKSVEADCDVCGGCGTVAKFARSTETVASPKDEVMRDLLDEHEDIGRLVIFGGFMGTIDRLTNLAHTEGWAVLQIDGRGFTATDAHSVTCDTDDFLDAMDLSNPRYRELLEKFPKVVVIANPVAGGMALTFTASPTILYYSNSFSGEARIQSEDRCHRMGMDQNRALTIIDIIHLPSDQLVLDNLKKKRKLQEISMGELEEAFNKNVSEDFQSVK